MHRNTAINLGYVLANLALMAFLMLPRGMAATEPEGTNIPQPVHHPMAPSADGGQDIKEVFLPSGDDGMRDDMKEDDAMKLAPVFRQLPTEDKVIALTFDDGPKATVKDILTILGEKDVPATFFLLGNSALNRPELARQILDAGCDIANHSWSHPDLTKISQEKLVWQLEASTLAFAAIGAECQSYMRPPYGSMDDTVRRVSADLGFDVVLWNVDTRDWQYKDTAVVLQRALSGLKAGSIVLFHDGPKVTLQVLPDFIDEARARGYEFVLISDYLRTPGKIKNYGNKAGQKIEDGEVMQ